MTLAYGAVAVALPWMVLDPDAPMSEGEAAAFLLLFASGLVSLATGLVVLERGSTAQLAGGHASRGGDTVDFTRAEPEFLRQVSALTRTSTRRTRA